MNTVPDKPDPQRFGSFREFYPFYLNEHRNANCRRMRFLGSTLGLICLGLLVASGQPGYLLLGVLAGYGCAWIGHFVFEKNRPATFKYPLYSFFGDWVMYKDMLTGRVAF